MDCFIKCSLKVYQEYLLIYLSTGIVIFGVLYHGISWNSVLGKCFKVLCGVRQGGVLSPYLFALYIDDVIDDLRKSGYGIYIGLIFVGCILYADDILLVSGSCTGLQQMVNVCVQYGKLWDISFNPAKSHYITFGGSFSSLTRITLNKRGIKEGC